MAVKGYSIKDTPQLRGFRERLVAQLQQKGIRDERLLAAMQRVLRHAFIESALAKKAYEDIPLPIGEGQTISQPYTVAYMTELLAIQPRERVLEVGTGSGYQAAILAEMGAQVFTVERHRPLYVRTNQLLKALGYSIHTRCGDGTLGWASMAPFDAIIVTAGGPQIPESLRKQLAIGGRMVIPVGSRDQQQMHYIRRLGETDFETHLLDGFRFVPLVGNEGW
jgi:protein-L-isoaspartate(D-aspartate) O-methyltransferase